MADYESILNYAEKYNMPLDTALNVDWWQKMADKAYLQGRTDAIEECIDMIKRCCPCEEVSSFGLLVCGLEQLKEKKNEIQ